jgi:hypothetical protein
MAGAMVPSQRRTGASIRRLSAPIPSDWSGGGGEDGRGAYRVDVSLAPKTARLSWITGTSELPALWSLIGDRRLSALISMVPAR